LVLIIFALIIRFFAINKDIIDFFTTGLDSGFKFSEIMLLHHIAEEAELEEPTALFWSVPALNQGIATILKDARSNGTESSEKIQSFLSKMYKYRTKVELDPRNSHSMKTTKSLSPGQRLRVVLRGRGVFSSRVINAGRELVIELPVQPGMPYIPGPEWVGKGISVYLNRPGDASYVFDTQVHNSVTAGNKTSLFLAHSDSLVRTQKRKSVRCACQIFAQLYLIRPDMDRTSVEVEPGLKCLIEDISEDGAMIRIGGAGKKDIAIKVQFPLDDKMVVMFGIIRAVEYNQQTNQSRLHFEYVMPDPVVRNAILTYVYNILPQDKKDELTAIAAAEKDEEMDAAAANEVIPGKDPDDNAHEGIPDYETPYPDEDDEDEEDEEEEFFP
ncbi:MAG: PilZ domain-containing protein, partial [Treponema sp.]|nr:PilZ domain-containing protein [Candidatus Treponema caballi]